MAQYKGFSRQLVLHLSDTAEMILVKLVERHGTENQGLTQLELREELDKGKSTISEAVTYLEENDFVEKDKHEKGNHPDVIKLKNPGLFQE